MAEAPPWANGVAAVAALASRRPLLIAGSVAVAIAAVVAVVNAFSWEVRRGAAAPLAGLAVAVFSAATFALAVLVVSAFRAIWRAKRAQATGERLRRLDVWLQRRHLDPAEHEALEQRTLRFGQLRRPGGAEAALATVCIVSGGVALALFLQAVEAMPTCRADACPLLAGSAIGSAPFAALLLGLGILAIAAGWNARQEDTKLRALEGEVVARAERGEPAPPGGAPGFAKGPPARRTPPPPVVIRTSARRQP